MNFHQVKPLNAAQKAWETRRANAEGRAFVQRQAAAEPVPVPPSLDGARMVEIELDRKDVGSGRRRYVVLDVGPRMVRLFSAPSLIAIDVHRIEFEKLARAVKFNSKTVVEIIRRNIALADRVNDKAGDMVLFDGGEAAVRAIAVLR